MDEETYTVDLLAGRTCGLRFKVDLGDGPMALDILAPRRRESRAVEQLMGLAEAKAAGEPCEGFDDALAACAAALLSRNAQGVRVSAEQAAEALDVAACARVVAACQSAWVREVERLGKGWSCQTTR